MPARDFNLTQLSSSTFDSVQGVCGRAQTNAITWQDFKGKVAPIQGKRTLFFQMYKRYFDNDREFKGTCMQIYLMKILGAFGLLLRFLKHLDYPGIGNSSLLFGNTNP
jgi:hypothetical protein